MILRGAPIPIHFLGFESDTYRLQRAGWQFAEERDIAFNRSRLFMRHPDIRGLSGVTGQFVTQSYYEYGGSVFYPDPIKVIIGMPTIIHAWGAMPSAFAPVDTRPEFIEETRYDLYDQPYFRPLDEGKEVFIEQASVQDILQIALDKQAPEQARIRAARQAEAKREEYRRGGRTVAKLIAI